MYSICDLFASLEVSPGLPTFFVLSLAILSQEERVVKHFFVLFFAEKSFQSRENVI